MMEPTKRELEGAKELIRQMRARLVQLEDENMALTMQYRKVLAAARVMDHELTAALAKAEKLHTIDLDELPAVYQVHNLQPLLQVKMDEALGSWLEMYSMLRERFVDIFESASVLDVESESTARSMSPSQ